MKGKPLSDTRSVRPKQQRLIAEHDASEGLMMRLLSLVLAAIGLLVVGAVSSACIFVIFGQSDLLHPVVLTAWGAIWRLGVLAIALFTLMTLIESVRS